MIQTSHAEYQCRRLPAHRDVVVTEVSGAALGALPVVVPVALTAARQPLLTCLALRLHVTVLRDVVDALSVRRPVRRNWTETCTLEGTRRESATPARRSDGFV